MLRVEDVGGKARVKGVGGKLLTVLLWAGVLVAAPLVGLRWVDSSIGMVVVLQTMIPIAAFGVAGLLLVAVVARRWRVAVVAGALFSVLVVMSANLDFGGADAPSVVTAVREHRVDVLVLLEITPDAVERLTVAGLDSPLPESVGLSRQDAGGTIIRSRVPLKLLDSGLGGSPLVFNQPVVSIHRPDGDVVLRAVHSPPPTLLDAADWRSGLVHLQAWRERQPAGQPLVMAGDFNSSQSHPGFRRVAETMTDAHRAAGEGWVRTWPEERRLIRPFIQLDHVLSRGLSVVDAGVVQLPGTDHAAVWARLSPPRP